MSGVFRVAGPSSDGSSLPRVRGGKGPSVLPPQRASGHTHNTTAHGAAVSDVLPAPFLAAVGALQAGRNPASLPVDVGRDPAAGLGHCPPIFEVSRLSFQGQYEDRSDDVDCFDRSRVGCRSSPVSLHSPWNSCPASGWPPVIPPLCGGPSLPCPCWHLGLDPGLRSSS